MKFAAVALLAASIAPSSVFAGSSQVHAFIGLEQMFVKTGSSDVTWFSNLEHMKVNGQHIDGSGTFMLYCGDDGKHYVMISVPLDKDIWPSQDEELRMKADVAAFGDSLEITDADTSSMKVSGERVMFVDLGDKISEFVRHWRSGMSVGVSVKPGNGLDDLNFIVAAPLPDTDARQKMAQTEALCKILTR